MGLNGWRKGVMKEKVCKMVVRPVGLCGPQTGGGKDEDKLLFKMERPVRTVMEGC